MKVLMAIILIGVFFIAATWFKEQQRVAEWYYRTYPETPVVVQIVRAVLLHPQNVKVVEPYDGQYVTYTFRVAGEARASWYENDMLTLSIENESGVEIERVRIQATGDSGTDAGAFVPFSTDVSLPNYYGPATLVFKQSGGNGEKRVDITVQ